MRDYCNYINHESEYQDDYLGSTNGMVVEWQLHNIAYFGTTAGQSAMELIGKTSNSLTALQEKAKEVNFGSTIFDDNHPGFSELMWFLYCFYYPADYFRDLTIYLNE